VNDKYMIECDHMFDMGFVCERCGYLVSTLLEKAEEYARRLRADLAAQKERTEEFKRLVEQRDEVIHGLDQDLAAARAERDKWQAKALELGMERVNNAQAVADARAEVERREAGFQHREGVWRREHAAFVRKAAESMRERAQTIVREQPNAPDTKVGKRHHWVKDQILAKLEALPLTETEGK
jgi:hypothetical protein